jgi:hypothetical protein
MQKTKLLVLSVLATLLVCSALSVVAAQEETPTSPPTPDDSVTSTVIPDQPEATPVEGNSSASGVGDAISGDNTTDTNTTDPIVPGAEDELLYANALADRNSAAPDNTWLFAAVGIALVVVAVGVIGVARFQKAKN